MSTFSMQARFILRAQKYLASFGLIGLSVVFCFAPVLAAQEDEPTTTNSADPSEAVAPATSASADVASPSTDDVIGPKGARASDFPPMVDVITTKSDTQLTGFIVKKISRSEPGETRDGWLFETASGGLLKLDSRTVDRVRRNDGKYGNVVFAMDPNSADDHWMVVKWCEQESSSHYKHEIEFHLRRIAALDPNDDTARRRLGLRLDDISGRWVRKEQLYETHGYTRVPGGYVPNGFLEIHEFEEDGDSSLGDRREKFNKWKKLLDTESNTRILQARLLEIADGYSVPMMYQFALDAGNPELRYMLVDAIGTVSTNVASNALVHFAVRDPSVAVRDHALALLTQEKYNPHAIALKASEFLVNEGLYVERAATVIGEMDSDAALLPLIHGLITIHTPPPTGQQRGGTSFTGDSQGGVGLSQGGAPPPVPAPRNNEQVLSVLRRISGRNIGFDEEAWKRWYTETQTISRIDVRRDE